MSDIISAEHFKLTPTIRSHVMKIVEKLQGLLPPHATIRVFLIEDAKNEHFTARFKVIIGRKELLASEQGYDLHVAISDAGDHIIRCVTDSRHRIVDARRRRESAFRSAV